MNSTMSKSKICHILYWCTACLINCIRIITANVQQCVQINICPTKRHIFFDKRYN